MDKQKNPFERAIKEGFAIMSDEEQNNQVGTIYNQEINSLQKYENLIYLSLGIGLGVIGSYISTWIYEMTRKGWSFHFLDLLFIFIFLILIGILIYSLNQYNSDFKFLRNTRELFLKNRVIITNPEKFEKYKQTSKKKTSQQ